MSNNKLPIFVGLPAITAEAAMELAYYWRVAGGNAVGHIDHLGHLYQDNNGVVGNMIWQRPCAAQNFKLLKEAFAGCEHPAVQVKGNWITVDFGMLQYNPDCIKDLMSKHGLGVCDPTDCEAPDRGLMFYIPKDSGANGTAWYQEGNWRYRDVTVAALNLKDCRICALSPHLSSPDETGWKKLYFVAA